MPHRAVLVALNIRLEALREATPRYLENLLAANLPSLEALASKSQRQIVAQYKLSESQGIFAH